MAGTLIPYEKHPRLKARRPPKYVNAYSLSSAEATTITVPPGAYVAVFSCTGNFYLDATGVAAVPSDVTDGTSAELIRGDSNEMERTRLVTPEGTISAIAPEDAVLTVSFYTY